MYFSHLLDPVYILPQNKDTLNTSIYTIGKNQSFEEHYSLAAFEIALLLKKAYNEIVYNH